MSGKKRRVLVIGGGAAGMMAAIAAAGAGAQVLLFEKNEKLGKKIYITGKGRCNFTNACSPEEFPGYVSTNPKFLYSAFGRFNNEDVIRFFEESGMKTKAERGGRMFPVSDHASDVTGALARRMRELGVAVHLSSPVRELVLDSAGERVCGLVLGDGSRQEGDAVIVATGGLSYPSTGSDGDGYRFAEKAGLAVKEQYPSLVPMTTLEADAAQMQGLSLRNAGVRILDGKKVLYSGFGEMMFTHFGVTGPLILTASSVIRKPWKHDTLRMEIDLKPALTEAQLDARLVREFETGANKQLRNVLGTLLPAKMIPVIIARSGISPEKPAHDISREERRRLLGLLKCLPYTLTGTRGFAEAIITNGGVSVRGIDPGTMEAKTVKGLYFAGEVLDVDAQTGGFNLQIAWSTGHAAGIAAAQPVQDAI